MVLRKYRYACQSGYDGTPIIEMDELMHEAYFGIVKASEIYSPDQGANFLTYAEHWIRQAAKRFLENSGRVIRVPVHTQQKVYKYYQVRAYYLRNYDREPDKHEYASWIGISLTGVNKLEQFMFQGAIRSLDEVIPGNDNDNLSLEDTIPAEIDVEEDAVEKLTDVQIREELWNIVSQVLKDKRKVRIFQLRYIDNLTMDQIGEQLHVSRNAIDQILRAGIRMLRCNSRTKNLGEELGIWSREYPIDAARVKRWAMEGELKFLNKREMKYAVNMGWIDSSMM